MIEGYTKQGLFIVFEGIDGTGKSTQIEMAAKEIQKNGYEVVMTREPTNGTYGQRIRELYVSRDSVSREQELELFLADRREHVETLIAPALKQGKTVISDRYYLSTAAYQGAAGLDPEKIMKENEKFAPKPDLALIIELPPSEAVMRIQSYRQEILNDFEQEDSLRQVDDVFQSLKRNYIRRIDGTKSIDQVHKLIMVHIDSLFFQ